MTSHGAKRLTVPLAEKKNKLLITEVQIETGLRWRNNFWRTLQSAYAASPYFSHYADELHKEIFFSHRYLYDLNFRLIIMCLNWLGWQKAVKETDRYDIGSGDRNDLRNVLQDGNGATGSSVSMKPYHQVFGTQFTPGLSIIDLIFCEGPHAESFLSDSTGQH